MLPSLTELVFQAKSDFKELLKKCWNSSTKYREAYGGLDARQDFFINLSELNLWLLLQLDYFTDTYLDSRTTKIARHMNLTPRSTIVFMLQHDTINRVAYCTHEMFSVEHFLRTISHAMGKQNSTGYYLLTKSLLTELKLYTEERHHILNAPAQIRNSLHNNGYHNQESFEISLKGRAYKFIKGNQIQFSGWDNLYIFFDSLVDCILEILEAPLVKQIIFIPHTSASEDKLFRQK